MKWTGRNACPTGRLLFVLSFTARANSFGGQTGMSVLYNKNPSRSPLRDGFSYWSPTYVITGATPLSRTDILVCPYFQTDRQECLSCKVGSPPALSPSPAGSLGIGQPRGWPILFPQTLQSVRKYRPVVCDLKCLANVRFGQRQTLIQDDSKLSP